MYVGVIAKDDDQAIACMRGLQEKKIISSFEEEPVEVDGKKAVLFYREKLGSLLIDSYCCDDRYEEDDDAVDLFVRHIDTIMKDGELLYTFEADE